MAGEVVPFAYLSGGGGDIVLAGHPTGEHFVVLNPMGEVWDVYNTGKQKQRPGSFKPTWAAFAKILDSGLYKSSYM